MRSNSKIFEVKWNNKNKIFQRKKHSFNKRSMLYWKKFKNSKTKLMKSNQQFKVKLISELLLKMKNLLLSNRKKKQLSNVKQRLRK